MYYSTVLATNSLDGSYVLRPQCFGLNNVSRFGRAPRPSHILYLDIWELKEIFIVQF